ncbi:MAG: aspartate/glutamate racemase family protein [Arenimonas sp.]|nr:aspartate/glutamate racemase family protein [Rhizobium sp.]MBW8447786.1 aspartate/glutamate racemase family protein [Arenimonas sp.]
MTARMTATTTIAMIHTVAGLVPTLDALARREMPGCEPFSILDESLLRNTIREGSLSKTTMRRLAQYVWSAVDGGAEAVIVTCSSLGPAVEAARPLCPVPLFRIDEGMALEAVSRASRIGVLATLRTTLGPTGDIIRTSAAITGRTGCEVTEMLCEGAFERLSRGDREGHDKMVVEGFRRLAPRVDLIVLAQASMANALAPLGPEPEGVPVLTSPELGMRHVRDRLFAANPRS